MILESLRDLAHRENLVEEPAFQSVPVRWVIDLDEQGHFLTLTDTAFVREAEGKRKPKPEFKRRSIPRRSGRTSGAKAEFLVDKSEYVLGILPEGEGDAQRLAERRELFISGLRDAQEKSFELELASVLSFLEDPEQRARCVDELKERKFASNDLFTFRVRGTFLDDVEGLRSYWARQIAASEASDAPRQCLICGQRKPSVEKHDSLRLSGAVTSGVPLISFNASAFEKHGLSKNENAPVCRDCMVAYVNALRRCLEEKYPRPDGRGSFPQQSVRLSYDTTAVYWDERDSELIGYLSLLNSDDPSAVKALLTAAWKGERPAFPDARFFCLILTGAQGRAALRGMHTGTVAAVAENVDTYFRCLETAGYEEQPAPIFVLTKSLAVQGKLDNLPPGIAAELFLAAVLGRPLSIWFLNTVVARIRAEREIPRPRAALLHLYFRLRKNERNIPMSLDVTSPDAAYRYGRLLAVLEALQYSAHQKKVNSTVVDRFYAAASTRPATVFPRLLALAQNHLKQSSAPGKYVKQITEIVDGLQGAKGFQPMLNIEEQGRFALGYFHQRASRFNDTNAPDDASDTTTSTEEAAA